jgi:hypothetical protein
MISRLRKQPQARAPMRSRKRARAASLEELVNEYLARRNACADDLAFYREAPTWREAVERATTAEWLNAKGEVKRHPHQRRIPEASLRQATRILKKADLQSAKNFDDLHNRIEHATRNVWKFKALTIYDTAHRIGACMKPRLRPKCIYLHRGTRQGARALGLGHGKDKLAMSELPPAIRRRMNAEQAEDFLCHRKSQLAEFAQPKLA